MLESILKEVSLVDISTIALSIAATVISVKALFVSKRQLINSAITNNRIEWINTVRNLVQSFVEEYLKCGTDNQYEKKVLAANIELYLRHDVSIYKPFFAVLKKCTLNTYREEDCLMLISTTQDLLNDVWNRMKREAGISERSEKRLKAKLKQEKLERGK